jgi:hypothetical protein
MKDRTCPSPSINKGKDYQMQILLQGDGLVFPTRGFDADWV